MEFLGKIFSLSKITVFLRVFSTRWNFPCRMIFSFVFDAHSLPVRLQTKENVAQHGKFCLVVSGVSMFIGEFWEKVFLRHIKTIALTSESTGARLNNSYCQKKIAN